MAPGWREVPGRWMWRRLQDGLRAVDVLGELFDGLNTCHHPSAGQILTTKMHPVSPLTSACGREVGGAKWVGGKPNVLNSLWHLRIQEYITNLFGSLWIF